jgi:alkanesulfonate monooxygenase SsuD/methylene tetrahydromethanopterin reductase-like flavin-dependent oxidoreductase (luciferase family)
MRAILGIGASGPQVIEGWHGVPYDRPLARTRETIAICRSVWRREVLVNDGLYQLPLPGGAGKPLKLRQELHRAGHKAEAAAAVPAELLEPTSLIGTDSYVRERIQAFADAGVTTLNVTPIGGDGRRQIARARELTT